MTERVVTVRLQLHNGQFLANTRAIENATNATWNRIADRSSVIGKRVKEWAKDARESIKGIFSTDEIGRGPFMKMLAALKDQRVAGMNMLKKNAAAIKGMFTADEIGRTPFMRMRDAAAKVKAASAAAIKKGALAMKSSVQKATSPDEIGRSPFNRMLSDMHNLEGKSIAAFKRIGNAAKSAYGGGSRGIGAASSWVDKKLYGSADGKKRGLASGLSNLRLSQNSEHGIGAMGVAGAFMAKDMITNIYNKGMGIVEDANHVSDAAAQLSVNARQAGKGYIDPKVLESEAYAVTQQVKGTKSSEVIDAMAQFTALTGDLKTARASMVTFATVAKATGSGLTDVAASTAAISQQFGITDPEQIKEVLASLTYQGKAGAIELSDLATGLQTLAASGASFGLKGVQGVKTLGGITQLAKQGSGSPAETFTAVQGIFRELTAKTTQLEKQKVKVYEGKGADKHTRDPTDIIIDAISTIGGNDIGKKATGLQSIFNDSLKGLKPLMSIYNNTVRDTKGTDAEKTAAGVAALRKAFDGAINAAGAWEDVVQDASNMQQTASAKTAAAGELMQSKIAENVAPKLTEFATMMATNVDALDAFVFAMEVVADVVEGFGIGLKALGIIKEHKKTSYEYRDEAKAKKEKAQAALTAMQMTPEQILAETAKDPNAVAEKRAQAQKLKDEVDSAALDEKGWNTWANKGGFEWDNDPNNRNPEKKTTSRSLKDKAREQKEAAAAVAADPAEQQRRAAQTNLYSNYMKDAGAEVGTGTRVSEGAPAARPGPIRLDGVSAVRIVGDDTTRGSIPSPTPGNVARL